MQDRGSNFTGMRLFQNETKSFSMSADMRLFQSETNYVFQGKLELFLYCHVISRTHCLTMTMMFV
jgi:hypothetical protein